VETTNEGKGRSPFRMTEEYLEHILSKLRDIIKNIQYGKLTIKIQDGKVTLAEKTTQERW
jgi:hypothetical protein